MDERPQGLREEFCTSDRMSDHKNERDATPLYCACRGVQVDMARDTMRDEVQRKKEVLKEATRSRPTAFNALSSHYYTPMASE